ncbi:hypothetical protein BJY00DRAFT_320090 [Aspergillus carlsbadensis]|nr:hypothetical protein BJY00DRAFT_320090 [Aspergillus carlsbadensis]
MSCSADQVDEAWPKCRRGMRLNVDCRYGMRLISHEESMARAVCHGGEDVWSKRDNLNRSKSRPEILYDDDPVSCPKCSVAGTCTYNDNVRDLEAAVATNHTGDTLLEGFVSENELEVVHFYMRGRG